jgi:hypothetical protein
MSCNVTDIETFHFGPHLYFSEAAMPGNMFTDVFGKFVLSPLEEEKAEVIQAGSTLNHSGNFARGALNKNFSRLLDGMR